ncbi:MAG: glycosyltransferase family 4 protein [Gallionella sp.]|nr:glycosyltransferase family 4 protein [Gallionella sp.]
MKLIFLNRYFFPDHSATSQMLADLAFHLAEVGHEVHVICSRQLYESPEAKLAAFEQVRGVKVHRVWTSRFGRANLVGRASDYLSFYFSATLKLLWLADAHTVVVAKTDPPLISVPVSWVTRWRGARLVNWLQDVFPEVAVELGVKALGGRLGGWVCHLRDNSLRAAMMNVVLGERMAERVRARGIDAGKVRVISNWADGEAITPIPAEANPLRAEWNLIGKFVVMYSGNMGRGHEFETILGAAALLQADARFVFLFVGGGNQRGPLGSEVARRGLTNVQFRPYQPREQLGLSLTVGDVHLISLRPELEGLIVPSKFYGVLAAGRPVVFVGAPDGEIARQVGQADCGVAVEQGDARGLAAGLVRLADAPAACKRMGWNGRRLFDGALSQSAALAAWEAILDDHTSNQFCSPY